MSTIEHITAHEILDSRGYPTLRVTTFTNDGYRGTADVPSGLSTGMKEALELRDGDCTRYHGKGVLKAIKNVIEIIYPSLKGKSIFEQSTIDQCMIGLDGTPNKSHLGANAILGVSISVAKAAAKVAKVPLYSYLSINKSICLPRPMVNIINGGQHGQNSLAFQEFMIFPHNFFTFKDSIRAACEVFYALKKILLEKNYSVAVGDEGGFSPNCTDPEEALEMIKLSIEHANYKLDTDINIALDCAASSFYDVEKELYIDNHYKRDTHQQINYQSHLTNTFPIYSIEDGLAEGDLLGWQELTKKLGKKIQLVGDDLFCTNSILLQEGIEKGMANAILVKLNQVGTLTETLEVIQLARKHKYNIIVSHRSGDTEDTFLADFAVGAGANQVKFGSVCRSERTAKYNRLLEIEREISL
ncbi:MAG: phosphopyruvate hydratase [Chlamydiales bacterium]